MILPIINFKEAINDSRQYIIARREGLITSLRTKFPTLDHYLIGGIPPNTITCISAMSGCGKSTLAKCIRNSIAELNVSQKVYTFVFNFEMLAREQIARELTTQLNMDLRDLYSANTRLSDKDFDRVEQSYIKMSQNNPDIYFIEISETAKVIKDSILYYYEKIVKPNNGVMVIELDHTLLTKGKEGQSEKDKIDALMYALVDVKKIIASDGGTFIGIVLSQMNRDIESVDRIKDPAGHVPKTSDLFGSSTILQCCDYVIINHIPDKLHILSYTPLELPTQYRIQSKESGFDIIQACYLHILKNRTGESGITIPLENRLKYFDFDELDKVEFATRHQQFKKTGLVLLNKQ
jgi:replicative DNA helicase